jgi:hypothetical protein
LQCRLSLRERIHSIYAQLVADNGRLAVALVDSFGIPDHLLQAPIATNWRVFNVQPESVTGAQFQQELND